MNAEKKAFPTKKNLLKVFGKWTCVDSIATPPRTAPIRTTRVVFGMKNKTIIKLYYVLTGCRHIKMKGNRWNERGDCLERWNSSSPNVYPSITMQI